MIQSEGNDRWVAEFFNYKKNGYFVEGGATVFNSSAKKLEKELDWNGICVSPNKDMCDMLDRKNVENAALFSHDGEVDFLSVPQGTFKNTENGLVDLSYMSAVSGLEYFDLSDVATLQKVKSITLETLLDKYNAPKVIDYLGLDIEGSEYEVLKVFPFDKYEILTMTIENSDKYQDFIESKGFIRVNNPYSKVKRDGCYINRIFRS